MIQISELTKSFGAQKLFENISWHIDKYKISALVGPNGTGKSTLMRIIAGEIDHDSGTLSIPNRTSVAYLPQEITQLPVMNALDLVLTGRKDLVEIENQLEKAKILLQYDNSQENIEKYGQLQHDFEDRGGYEYVPRAKSILASLGFTINDLDKNTDEFSGGWQMRLLLAQILMQNPDLLLLDEPTNHLDLESLDWLETFIVNSNSTVILVSHDRAFLNRTVQAVAAMDQNGLLIYPGNYDRYLETRDAIIEQQKQLAAQQKKNIAETQAFIDRFRYKATKAKQVQSRIKALDKIQQIDILQKSKKLRFRFPEPEKTPQLVIELKNIHKAYDDNIIYDNLNLNIYRNEKIALIAPNGAGKSTLMKIIADKIPYSGERIIADRVNMSHFTQHQIEALDFKKSLLDEAYHGLEHLTVTQIRSALGAFLFNAEDIEKPVAVLSGGEKNKLALTKILLRAPNLLLLDEPTNHLDLDSREALEDALRLYPATIIVISHDRTFIDKICNKIITIHNGSLIEFPGNYSDWEFHNKNRITAAFDPKTEKKTDETDTNANAQKQKRIQSAALRAEIKKATQHIEKDIKKCETEIESHEKLLAEVNAELIDSETYKYPDKIEKLSINSNKLETTIENLYSRWTELQIQLEEALQPFQ